MPRKEPLQQNEDKLRPAFSKIIVKAIIIFTLLFMAQNAILQWVVDEYDSSVAVSLTIILGTCVATYFWRAQASDSYQYSKYWVDQVVEFNKRRLDIYIKLKSEHPEEDFSDLPELSDLPDLELPDNISNT